jgi:hypothetical protein
MKVKKNKKGLTAITEILLKVTLNTKTLTHLPNRIPQCNISPDFILHQKSDYTTP